MKEKTSVSFAASTFAMMSSFALQAASPIAWPELDAHSKKAYDSIFAPRVVAVAPGDAPANFHVKPDGVLCAYGKRKYGEKPVAIAYESRDLGLNWKERARRPGEVMLIPCPWSDYWILVQGPATNKADFGWCRKRLGANGPVTCSAVPGVNRYGRLCALPKLKRWMYVSYEKKKDMLGYYPWVVYSDDDGDSWSPVNYIRDTVDIAGAVWPDAAPRWEVGSNEADIVEMNDGRIVMFVRTSHDHAAWYTSHDGGQTWGKPYELPAFWMSNTMPHLLKLRDGRILCIWNNTQILPKLPLSETPELSECERCGRWESVFTNRDALHAAITEDDGKTWIGFREIALSEIRNRGDYREFGNEFWHRGIDKSVHQSQAIELPGGKIAVLYGQNVSSRRIAIFDIDWLYEKERTEDLRHGLENISHHLYVKSLQGGSRGWSGHASLNRVPGAVMTREPETGTKTKSECLRICRIRDERLISDRQGVVWNFPAAKKGEVSFECRIDGAGVRLSLCDHWINPCDWAIESRAVASLPMEAETIGGSGKWVVVKVAWNRDADTARLSVGGVERVFKMKKDGFSPYGISYLHLQTTAEGHDPVGSCFRWFKMRSTEE